MRFVSATPLVIVLALAACSDWPEVDVSGRTDADLAWPSLRPLDDSTSSATLPADNATAFDTLQARSDQLRARAALLRTPVPDQASFDHLRARLAG